MTRKPYPTDLTDDQWERLRPFLPKSQAGTPRGGRPPTDTREILNAVFYHLRAGGAWRLLPHDFPPWPTVYTRFRQWRDAGVWDAIHARIRDEVRIEAGHPPAPLTGRIDSQTVKTTHRGGDRGYDGGKKVTGRKRFLLADSLGLIWALWVMTAAVPDRDGGRWLLRTFAGRLPRVREVIADSGFRRRFVDRVRRHLHWRVTTTATAPEGFRIHPRRWVVERTFAWLVQYRRLGKDYEYQTESSEAMISAAMTHRMLRLLHPA